MDQATLSIGIYQAAGSPGDVVANLDEMLAAIDRAAASGVELLVFPEGFLTGYYLPEIDAAALPETTTAIERLREHAKRTGVATVFGSAERDGDRVFNTAIALSAEGAVLARYRKRALFGDWERGFFTRGAEPVLFDIAGFRVGLLICYDLEFPELARETAAAGADLIVVPTSLMVPNDAVAEHLVPTRAMENQIFVAYANRTGTENGLSYVGKSSICDPSGRALTRAGSGGPTMISAMLKKSAIAEARADFSYHEDLVRLPL